MYRLKELLCMFHVAFGHIVCSRMEGCMTSSFM